jgi:paraquat-inducible protein B
LNQTLKDADALVNNLNTKIGPQIASSIQETLSAAQDTLKVANKAIGEINRVAGKNENLGYEIDRTLKQIAELSRSIRVLADYLERHPEALLRGKNPAE